MKTRIASDLKNTILIILLIATHFCMMSCEKENKIVKWKEISGVEKDPEKIKDSAKINLDQFHIFSVMSLENEGKYRNFISLSELYQDSITVPPEYITNQKKIPFEKLRRIELSKFYREKLLKATGFKEQDSLFVYNYDLNKLEKYPLNRLKAVANLNGYSSEGEDILDYYYQVGFELNEIITKETESDFYYNSLVYIGAENPFAQKVLDNIKWKKIPNNNFPEATGKLTKNDSIKGTYGYSNKNFHYYVQDWKSGDYREKRFFKTVNRNTGVNFTREFDNSDEGSGLTKLNGIDDKEYTDYQWTGELFKNKPPVIFDFTNSSFGCPEIIFLDASYPRFHINCDSRH